MTVPTSTAAHPDLDWSQVRETLLMLGLAISQIEMAMKDSGESVGQLADSFTTMFVTASMTWLRSFRILRACTIRANGWACSKKSAPSAP